MLQEALTSSFSLTTALLAGILGCVIYLLLSRIFAREPKNLPPGPRGWRTTLKLLKASRDETLHELAAEWAREYGPIVLYYSLGQPMVLLNNAEISRKLYASDDYKHLLCDRVPLYASKMAFYNSKDILFTPFDAIMRKKRKMFFQLIGLYGDGVEKFENVVSEELDRCLQEIEKHVDDDIDVHKFIGRSLKVIFHILTLGEHPSDISTPDILEQYDLAFNSLLSPSTDLVLSYFPFLAKVPGPFKTKVDRMKNCMAQAEELVYHRPKSTHVPGQPRGMADLLFDLQDKPGYEFMAKDEEHVIGFLMSLFAAGHITTRASVLGAFLCLLNNPEAMHKVQAEIDQVLGARKPRVEDRLHMPYTEACVNETLRTVSQSPLSGFRVAKEDMNVDGYTIPKGSVVIINHWFFLHDEKFWEDPWTFKPERFLDEKGHLLPANHPIRKSTINFGIGLRSCPGEVFARSRVFLFITNVLQKFDLLPPRHDKLVPADFTVNDDSVKGFVRQVQKYKARFQPRKGKRVEGK